MSSQGLSSLSGCLHIKVLVQVFLPVQHSGKGVMRSSRWWPLPPIWETWMESLGPSLSLTQPWPSWPSGTRFTHLGSEPANGRSLPFSLKGRDLTCCATELAPESVSMEKM